MPFPCPKFVKKLIEYLERFFALIDHNHDTDYAPLDHNHDERYYTETEVDALIAGISGAMVGEIRMWPTSQPPSGWLMCNGQTITISNYPDLFDVIGWSFGDYTPTTFDLPDFTRRFPIGVDTSGMDPILLGSTGGEEEHTLTVDELPSHAHPLQGDFVIHWEDGGPSYYYTVSGSKHYFGAGDTDSVGGDQGHSNMPPYFAIYFIIYAGV